MSRDKKPEPGHSGHCERWRHGALHHPALSLTKHQCGPSILGTSILSISISSSSMADTVYQFTVDTIDGAAVRLDNYRGRVLCIVNVASR